MSCTMCISLGKNDSNYTPRIYVLDQETPKKSQRKKGNYRWKHKTGTWRKILNKKREFNTLGSSSSELSIFTKPMNNPMDYTISFKFIRWGLSKSTMLSSALFESPLSRRCCYKWMMEQSAGNFLLNLTLLKAFRMKIMSTMNIKLLVNKKVSQKISNGLVARF